MLNLHVVVINLNMSGSQTIGYTQEKEDQVRKHFGFVLGK